MFYLPPAPSHSVRDTHTLCPQVCYHCLKVLPSAHGLPVSNQPTAVRSRSHNFCSTNCLSAAHSSYYSLESQLPQLQELERYCTAHGERFPLMATRLALTIAQGSVGSDTAAADGGDISRMSMSSKSSSIGRSSRGLGTLSWRSNNSYKRGDDVLSRASSSLAAAGTRDGAGELGVANRLSWCQHGSGDYCLSYRQPRQDVGQACTNPSLHNMCSRDCCMRLIICSITATTASSAMKVDNGVIGRLAVA